MKVTPIVIFSLGFLATIYAFPGQRASSEEVEFVPLEAQNGGPIIDTGVIEGPWFSPFDGIFDSLAGLMNRVRSQMDQILRRLPLGNSTFEGDGSLNIFPSIGDLDLGKGNTTSVTKIIDGHKVVINETEFKKEGAHGGAFFKVRVIDVLPNTSDELTTEKDAEEVTTSKDFESIENEIPKNRENEVSDNIETFDEPDHSQTDRSPQRNKHSTDLEHDYVKPIYPPYDLSRDTYVNEILANAGAPTNPDAEVFSNEKLTLPRVTKWDNLESFEEESLEDNSIDSDNPYDLNRDTYINQILADAGAPTDPDAEVFSEVEFKVPYGNLRWSPYKPTNPR